MEETIPLKKKVRIIKTESFLKKANKKFTQYNLKIPKKIADVMKLTNKDQIEFAIKYDKKKKPYLHIELIKEQK